MQIEITSFVIHDSRFEIQGSWTRIQDSAIKYIRPAIHGIYYAIDDTWTTIQDIRLATQDIQRLIQCALVSHLFLRYHLMYVSWCNVGKLNAFPGQIDLLQLYYSSDNLHCNNDDNECNDDDEYEDHTALLWGRATARLKPFARVSKMRELAKILRDFADFLNPGFS